MTATKQETTLPAFKAPGSSEWQPLVVEDADNKDQQNSVREHRNLRPGEAAIIGVDFPIPLKLQIREPNTKPKSEGPSYLNRPDFSGGSIL